VFLIVVQDLIYGWFGLVTLLWFTISWVFMGHMTGCVMLSGLDHGLRKCH
jgi:hypothetical protein